MSDGKLHKELSRAQRAKEVLDNELFNEAFTMLEQRFIHAWINAPVRDVEGQCKLKIMVNALREVKGHLETVLNTGKMAKIQIEENEEKKRRQKRAKKA